MLEAIARVAELDVWPATRSGPEHACCSTRPNIDLVQRRVERLAAYVRRSLAVSTLLRP